MSGWICSFCHTSGPGVSAWHFIIRHEVECRRAAAYCKPQVSVQGFRLNALAAGCQRARNKQCIILRPEQLHDHFGVIMRYIMLQLD